MKKKKKIEKRDFRQLIVWQGSRLEDSERMNQTDRKDAANASRGSFKRGFWT